MRRGSSTSTWPRRSRAERAGRAWFCPRPEALRAPDWARSSAPGARRREARRSGAPANFGEASSKFLLHREAGDLRSHQAQRQAKLLADKRFEIRPARSARRCPDRCGSRRQARATAGGRTAASPRKRVPAGAATCSTKTKRPPGLSTRRISRSTASGSLTEHRTKVETTVSTLESAAGSVSAPQRRMSAARDRRGGGPQQVGVHVRIRFHADPSRRLWKVAQVRTGAGADFQHVALDRAQQSSFTILHQPLVAPGEARHQPGVNAFHALARKPVSRLNSSSEL